MPGKKSASLQNVSMYERLREKGHSKESAARISNARMPGRKVTAPPPMHRMQDGHMMADSDMPKVMRRK